MLITSYSYVQGKIWFTVMIKGISSFLLSFALCVTTRSDAAGVKRLRRSTPFPVGTVALRVYKKRKERKLILS